MKCSAPRRLAAALCLLPFYRYNINPDMISYIRAILDEDYQVITAANGLSRSRSPE